MRNDIVLRSLKSNVLLKRLVSCRLNGDMRYSQCTLLYHSENKMIDC